MLRRIDLPTTEKGRNMAQIHLNKSQDQPNQGFGAVYPSFNSQSVGVAPAGEPKNDLMESAIFSAPLSLFDRMGGMLNPKKWYNGTASANYAKYEQNRKPKDLQAAFENWVKSADEYASDAALNRLIALFKDGKIYLGMFGDNLKPYQFTTSLDLFQIAVKSGQLPHWVALLEAFKFHWDNTVDFDRILLSEGATLCRMLSERATPALESARFLEDLKAFGADLKKKLCEQPAYLYDVFLAKIYYDLEMSFDKKAFLGNLKSNAESHGQVYWNYLVEKDFYLTSEVKTETLGHAGLYKETYVQNAVTALSNFVANRLEIEVKDNIIYLNDKPFSAKEAEFTMHLALELKNTHKDGDIPLGKLAAFLTELQKFAVDNKVQGFLSSAVSILPAPAQKSAPVVASERPELVSDRVETPVAQGKLCEAFETFKQTKETTVLNEYVPNSAEVGKFLRQYGGTKKTKPESEDERKVLLDFLQAMQFNCFKKPSGRISASEQDARNAVNAAIARLTNAK